MFSPYDPYVPLHPSIEALRQDTLRLAHGRISPGGRSALYRVVDAGTHTVVAEGSRGACLDHVIRAWDDVLWVPDPSARVHAQSVALRLTFERWDDTQQQWVGDRLLTDTLTDMHTAI